MQYAGEQKPPGVLPKILETRFLGTALILYALDQSENSSGNSTGMAETHG